MEKREKMEREINLGEWFWNILLAWRQVISFGILCAVLFGGIKYLRDSKSYRTAQNAVAEQGEVELTAEEKEKIEDAKIMMTRIDNYQKYLDTSVLMQINPYEKPVVELQYYVESDYTYNYTKDNQADYTGDLISLYYNYIKSGEMSDKIIDRAGLDISQADFSELCSVSASGKTMVITITWNEEEKLEAISESIKSQLSEKELEFQEIGTHRLKILRESQNVIADSDLAERKNTISNNIAYIDTQLNSLKLTMSEPQLRQLRIESGLEDEYEKVEFTKPVFSFKYMLLGAVSGVFVICVWIMCKMIFAVTLQDPEEIRTLYNTRLLGEVVVLSKRKKFLSVIDVKIQALKNRRRKKFSLEQQVRVVGANIALSCRQQGIDCIYITGSEYETINMETLSKLKKELLSQDIQIEEGGNIFYDAKALKDSTEVGNILFIEQIKKSLYDEISNELNLAKEQNNNILGVVVLV